MKKDDRHGMVKIVDGKPYLWTSKGYMLAQTEKAFAITRSKKWFYDGFTFFPHKKHGYPKANAVKIEGKHTHDE